MKTDFYKPLKNIEIRSCEVDFNTFMGQVMRTKVDPSFQRDGGWRELDKSEFLSLTEISGNILSPIYICDVRECLRNAEDQETRDYFSDILNIDKKDFLSVDGNNRSQTLLSNQDLIRSENWIILSNNITVYKIRKISKKALPLLFRCLNSNLKQTNQVMRNTMSTYLTSLIIDMKSLIPSLTTFFDLGKKLDQEFIARCLMITDNYLSKNSKEPIGLHTNNLNSFYKKNHTQLNLHPDTINITNSILTRVNNIIRNNPNNYGRGQVFLISLYMLLLFEYRNIPINDSIFINTLYRMNNHLLSNNDYFNSVKYHGKSVVCLRYKMIRELIMERENTFLTPMPEMA